MLAQEVSRLLRAPSPLLQGHIERLLLDQGVTLPFDLGLHFRQCVDCGWTMKLSTLLDNVACALSHAHLRKKATIFITSDSQRYMTEIRAALPSSAIVVDNLQPLFIHTVVKNKSASAADDRRAHALRHLPYLDNYLLSRSRVVGSCLTTYGQVGIHQHGSAVKKVVTWTHHEKHNATPTCSSFQRPAAPPKRGAPVRSGAGVLGVKEAECSEGALRVFDCLEK